MMEKVVNPHAKKILSKIPVIGCDGDGIVVKESIDKNFYNTNIIVFRSHKYTGKTPCCLYVPIKEEKIIFYVYPNFVKEINPKDTLFFSIDNPKPEVLKVDLATYQYIHCNCKKYSSIESFEILNTPCINLYDESLKYRELYEKLASLNGIYVEGASGTIIRSFFGIFFDTKGVVPLARINNDYVLFKTIGNIEVISTQYFGEIISRPEIEERELTSLSKVIDDRDLQSYYIGSEDVYILTGLKFAAKIKRKRITVVDDKETRTGVVVVGKFGDVLITCKKKVYIIRTKTAKETAELLEKLNESDTINIKESTTTLTDLNWFYVYDFELS